ncbi:MAG: hypothetical protein ACLPPV_21195 [Candidatus Korobacteraceae bacterium]
MKSGLLFVVVVCAVVLVGFAVHDIVTFGMGILGSATHAPGQFRDALANAVAWGMEYKEGVTIAFIVCLAALYLARHPGAKPR